MKTEQEQIDIAKFATIYEVFTGILKDQLTIEEMEKMMIRVNQWVDGHKQWMNRWNANGE